MSRKSDRVIYSLEEHHEEEQKKSKLYKKNIYELFDKLKQLLKDMALLISYVGSEYDGKRMRRKITKRRDKIKKLIQVISEKLNDMKQKNELSNEQLQMLHSKKYQLVLQYDALLSKMKEQFQLYPQLEETIDDTKEKSAEKEVKKEETQESTEKKDKSLHRSWASYFSSNTIKRWTGGYKEKEQGNLQTSLSFREMASEEDDEEYDEGAPLNVLKEEEIDELISKEREDELMVAEEEQKLQKILLDLQTEELQKQSLQLAQVQSNVKEAEKLVSAGAEDLKKASKYGTLGMLLTGSLIGGMLGGPIGAAAAYSGMTALSTGLAVGIGTGVITGGSVGVGAKKLSNRAAGLYKSTRRAKNESAQPSTTTTASSSTTSTTSESMNDSIHADELSDEELD